MTDIESDAARFGNELDIAWQPYGRTRLDGPRVYAAAGCPGRADQARLVRQPLSRERVDPPARDLQEACGTLRRKRPADESQRRDILTARALIGLTHAWAAPRNHGRLAPSG